MKLLIRLGLFIFGVISVIAFSLSLSSVRDLYVHAPGAAAQAPRYRFALYLPDSRSGFFAAVVRGAERAAAETSTVFSVHSVDPALKELEMASLTGVDGVVVCPYLDDSLAKAQLEKLSAKGIPLVLINHNLTRDQPWPFIGSNNFEVGRRMGTLARSASKGGARVGVVYSDKAPGMNAERELVEMGISAAMEGRLAAPILGLRTGLNPMDAEAMVYRLYRSGSSLDTLIFTDANDSVAAVQALIDMNLVGRVRIIGFGNEPALLEYVRKGIVAGSVAVNPEKIGYEALRSLAELRSTGYTSTSVDTGVVVIDRNSL